jgi:periplasmic divalent cation tolerance protein
LQSGRKWFQTDINDIKLPTEEWAWSAWIDKLGRETFMTNARIILTTAGSQEEARKIAKALVERKLAACVNIVPRIESVYRWQGKVETAEEWLLLIKTQAELFERVRGALKELHSYELPECVMLEVSAGSEEYLQWIAENTE